MGALRARRDAFLGRGDASVTIPAMDGALRPNQHLDRARIVRVAPAPDCLVVRGDEVLYASGGTVYRLQAGAPADAAVAAFGATVTCLAADADGALAVGLDDGQLVVQRASGSQALRAGGRCPTAVAFDGGSVVVAHGSASHPPSRWRYDLMQRGASGSVWRAPLDGGAPSLLAEGLGWPAGLLVRGGTVTVSESWRHRLVRLEGRAVTAVLDDLPGYPGRLAPDASDGALLAMFAPRSQLVEFVLREPAYRRRMMAEIDEAYWIAPALVSGRSFLEPLQGGGVKHMATLNPWAPTRSYGLVARLDASCKPVASWHSRAGGAFHGVTSAIEHSGVLLASSAGGDAIVAVDGRDAAA